MIKTIVKNYMNHKEAIRKIFEVHEPKTYKDIVKTIVETCGEVEPWVNLDANKIHEIDDGDYQGTYLYVIPQEAYQPNRYWFVYVAYGSCSGCDTLEYIQCDEDANRRIDNYMTLALHIVQNIQEIKGETVEQ